MSDNAELIELPTEVVAEFIRAEIKLDCDLRVLAPEGVEIDEWEHIDRASVEYVEYDDGDLMAHYESETTIHEKTHEATRWEPAAYKHHDAAVHIGVLWDMDPETQPQVDIEVVET